MKLFRRKRAQRQPKPRRIIFLRKRYLAIPGAILVICALCLVINLPTYVTASTTDRQLPIYCVQRDYKVCSLTFDAAWGNAILRHMPPQAAWPFSPAGQLFQASGFHGIRKAGTWNIAMRRPFVQFSLTCVRKKNLTGIIVLRSLPGYGRS